MASAMETVPGMLTLNSGQHRRDKRHAAVGGGSPSRMLRSIVCSGQAACDIATRQ